MPTTTAIDTFLSRRVKKELRHTGSAAEIMENLLREYRLLGEKGRIELFAAVVAELSAYALIDRTGKDIRQ